ncbi:MAG: hypothetical protein QOD46_1239 [Actinomycetota bacterium]|nr:hypothetical protein [Actinomycetota bacterium]
MFVPSAIWIFDGSEQPGRPLQPWKAEFAFGRASSLTTVPAGKKAEQAPEPLPKVIVKVALLDPAATVTLAGTVAAAVLSLDRATV